MPDLERIAGPASVDGAGGDCGHSASGTPKSDAGVLRWKNLLNQSVWPSWPYFSLGAPERVDPSRGRLASVRQQYSSPRRASPEREPIVSHPPAFHGSHSGRASGRRPGRRTPAEKLVELELVRRFGDLFSLTAGGAVPDPPGLSSVGKRLRPSARSRVLEGSKPVALGRPLYGRGIASRRRAHGRSRWCTRSLVRLASANEASLSAIGWRRSPHSRVDLGLSSTQAEPRTICMTLDTAQVARVPGPIKLGKRPAAGRDALRPRRKDVCSPGLPRVRTRHPARGRPDGRAPRGALPQPGRSEGGVGRGAGGGRRGGSDDRRVGPDVLRGRREPGADRTAPFGPG